MPIAPLPAETARRITSTLALNDAASVIKELIDNALDGRANTISVELAANTLDTIQVKDNGVGIGVEDRQLLCKRGCTSKIRSIEELAGLGGRFLGFRGEALASIAELSRFTTVSTCVDGELVGSAMKFKPDGQLESSSSASHPSGTTVRIQDILTNDPVRRQTALKSIAKTIANIHRLLSSYAYARPEVRYSFKVLKGKNDKAGWTYVPSLSGATLSDVASKIEGKEVTSYCAEQEINSDDLLNAHGEPLWVLRGIFILPNADRPKESSHAQFLSIDGRPLNADRGVMKRLVKLYKQYLNQALASDTSASIVSKPFLCLQITCPPESYDVNIEPAKDEVLFTNATIVQDLFEKLLRRFYGNLNVDAKQLSLQKIPDNARNSSKPFDILLARKRPQYAENSNTQEPVPGLSAVPSQYVDNIELDTETPHSSDVYSTTSSPQKTCAPVQIHSNMFFVDRDTLSEDHDLISNNSIGLDELPLIDNDASISTARNPWSIASLNSRVVPGRTNAEFCAAANITPLKNRTSSGPESQPISSSPQTVSASHRTPLGGDWQLPTPAKSPNFITPYQNPGPPMRRRAVVEDQSDDSEVSMATETEENRLSVRTLDSWMTPGLSKSRLHDVSTSDRSSIVEGIETLNGEDFTANNVPRRPSGEASSLAANRNQTRITLQPFQNNHPFKSPAKRSGTSATLHDHSQGTNSSTNVWLDTSQSPRQAPNAQPIQNAELEEIMAFEYQKRALAAQRRKAIKSGFKPPRMASASSGSRPESSIAAEYPNDRAPISTNASNFDREKAAFAARFGDIEESRSQSSTRSPSNPHRNRYLAASKRLLQSDVSSHSHQGQSAHDNDMSDHAEAASRSLASPHQKDHRPTNAFDILEHNSPTIPDSDPWAYLIRHHNLESKSQTNYGMVRTGLKLRRVPTTKLPLETIPTGSETYSLEWTVNPHLYHPTARHEDVVALENLDEYVRHGEVRSIKWNPFSREVGRWEDVLKSFVQTKYRPKHEPSNVVEAGDELTSNVDDGEHESLDNDANKQDPRRFEFNISLSRAIKAHVDAG